MKLEDWNQRWVDKKTGWQRPEANPRLIKYFKPGSKKVLVPLCGKTLDMIWLRDQDVEVVGAEFSAIGIKEFFAENDIQYETLEQDNCTTHVSLDGKIKIYQGDFFAMPKIDTFGGFDFVWDRAAMVAINPPDRAKYAAKIDSMLAPAGTIILEALEREEGRTGPPHTLTKESIVESYSTLGFKLEELESFEDLSSVDRLGKLGVHDYRLKRE